MNRTPNFQIALHDFQSAHLRGKLQGVLARITGKSNELLSYQEVASKLRLQGRSDRGLQMIPVDAIIGSVGRYSDFTRTFLPRRLEDRQRWAGIKAASLDPLGEGLPPIEVYKVSEVYFVLDGNHRVSIARRESWKTIQAHVIEVRTDIPLTPDVQADELIVKAEYAEFLEQTGLNRLQPQVDLQLTIPGGYQRLLDEVSLHRHQLQAQGARDVSLQATAESWYNDIYLPFTEAVSERGMMRWFPNRTVADLYVWMSEHRLELEKELGWDIRPETAAEAVIRDRNRRATGEESKTGSWRKRRLLNRYTEHLFRDILVPISGDSAGWEAVDQAIEIAHREDAHVLALHTVENRQEAGAPEVKALQERFNQICKHHEVQGSLAFEVGEPTPKILERAALADLIVIKIVHPPSTGIKSLTSPVRTLLARASRPILALPGSISRFHRALLAFDGSPKAKEALFVATYLAEQWGTSLTVLTGREDQVHDSSAEEFARNYLEFNEVEARFIREEYSPAVLKLTAEEVNADLVVMGGYSGSILKEMTIGSSVDHMLRGSFFPILICR